MTWKCCVHEEFPGEGECCLTCEGGTCMIGVNPPALQSRLIIAGVVLYFMAAFVVGLYFEPTPAPYPYIRLASDDGGQSYYVTEVEPGIQWGHFVPFGCNQRPFGPVEVGDRVTKCNGSLALDYNALEF